MTTDFDQLINRRGSPNLNKWTLQPEDVLPLWVADMDFLTPEPIRAALRQAVDHGVLGYEMPGPALLETVARRVERLYGWAVAPEMILVSPGVGAGMSAALRALTQPGDGILVQPPIFPPFIQLPQATGRVVQPAALSRSLQNGHWHYQPDPAAFAQAVGSGGAPSKLFLLCNPHNPTGRMFTRAELAPLAEVCLRHHILVCADEIHHGILLEGEAHLPIASLSAEIASHSLTFLGPDKTFNMSGLHCAFIIIPEPGLRQTVAGALAEAVLEPNSLGLVAAQAAFSGACDDWLLELRQYLRANRDFALDFLAAELPEICATRPEATYLLWLDCAPLRQTGRLSGSPRQFFLEQARVALLDGAEFGPGGADFVRLNFACPRSTLAEALRRMQQALG